MIVDIADERKPKVVSKIFNEVTLPENCAAVAADSASFPSNGLTKGDVFGARRLARVPLRLALLLDRPHARPDDRRVRELRLRHPRVRHPRPAGAEGDRLLQPGHDGLARGRRRERDRRAAGDPQRPRPDLVRRHRQGLPRRAVPRRRVAVRRPGPVPARGPLPRAVRPRLPRLPRAARAKTIQLPERAHVPQPAQLHDPPAPAARGGRIKSARVFVNGKRVQGRCAASGCARA